MLDEHCRPLHDPHTMLVDVLRMMARNDFPLAIPPRRLAELFGMVNRAVSLKMLANKWPLEASSDMDHDCQNYLSASSQNIENDPRRYKRQRRKFRAQENTLLLDDASRPLRFPDSDKALPPIPAGLANHRPCFWLSAPDVASAPKRERDLSPGAPDVMSDIPGPN